MQNEIIDIQFLRSLAPFTNRDTAISKLQSLTWSVGKPAVATYKVGSETRGLLAIGIADGVGKCRILADDEDFQTLKVYTEALNKKVDDYIEVTDAWKEVVDAWRSVTDDRLVELEGKSHVQNTDTGTTSPTFQVDSTSNGPKLKGKGGDLELRNAGDTDYAGLTLGDITIKGNVTQEGDTFISKAETVEINDNLLLINKGEVGAGVTKGIAGIEIDRGTLPNYQIIFDESDKRFKAGEVGNIWPLALRDEETNMVDGMFVTWDSTTKRLKTTNTVPSNRKLFFTDTNSYLQLVSHDFSGTILVQTLTYTNAKGSLFVSAGDSNLNLDTDKTNFRFYKNLIVPSSIDAGTDMILKRNGTTKLTLKDTVAQFTVPVTATTFNRTSDGSEALYHADIVDDLVTGGTGKVLSAEQGKLLSSKVNEIGDTYLPLSAGSGKHVTGDLYLDQKIYMKNLKPIYVQDSKGNNMQVLQGATLDGEEVIQLGASSKIRVESVTDFSKAVKFKDTVVLGADSKLYYGVSSSSSRIILDPAGGNIVLGNVNVQDMKFSTAVGKDLYHLEGTTPYKIWTAHSFDPDSKANRINPVVEQTLTLNTSTTGYKVKLGADDMGYPGMFVSTQAGVSKSSLYYSPKSDAWEIFTGAQSGVIATQNWVIDQVPTIFYARGFEVRKYNAAVNLDSDLLYGGAAVNYSDLTYWTNAPEGFSYGTVYQLGLQDYTNLNAQLAFDIIHTSDTDQKTNHLWFRTSGKAGYGVAGWKRVVTADELEGYVPSGDLANYYTKTQSDARYWTKTELVDPATKSGNNTFTGTNTFTAGKFSVGGLSINNLSSLVVDLGSSAGSWSRFLRFMASDASRGASYGVYSSGGATNYAWIGIGDVGYSNAQYIFAPAKMQVPLVWSLDDTNGNALVWSQSATLANLGRATGTTKIRSGAVDLIHTKGTTDYKILDESNWESIIPNSRWTYGFVGVNMNEALDLNTALIGPNNPKLVRNYATTTYWQNQPTGMEYGMVYQFWNSEQSETAPSLMAQLAFDVLHNVANGTGRMWFRTPNNLGYGDSSNWKRVVTADENVVAFITANGYPTVGRLDGSDIGWLRTPTNGLLPTSPVSLNNGGDSSLGNSSWAFNSASISNVYANNYYFGNTGMHLEATGDELSLLNTGVAKKLKIGSLLVSANYSDTVKVPTNGIYSMGRIQSNDSMLVGYSGDVTGGMLGYGLYYKGTFAQGLGSEYSSGALVLYKMLNPNKGKAGYNVPRAVTGTPTYLKINSGYLTLGVGENKAYTAGEDVTVTEYTVLHQGNGFYLGVPTTYVPVRMDAAKAALATGNGYLEWWNSGAGWVNHRAGKYIVNGGSSSQFLKGDGSLDSTAYLPLTGGTLTGQLTIKQSVDIKLRLQSTDTDNYCIIQAINAQASQLGVFGYAGDKWAIGHGGTYYEIWDKYNLTDPVTYTTNAYNHATLKNKNGQYFAYIKAGTNGLLPHSQVTLANGGAGFLGTSDQSFNAAYINNLHTNKVTFGETGPYIIGSTPATQFLNAEGSAQKVATGGLYVGPSYTSDDLSLVPANGIYSRGIIYIENGIGFRNSIWTNDLTPNKNYSGYLQVLDAYDASSAGGPTNYGTVLQVNSRNAHWANQLWFPGGAEASKNGLYYRHMAYNETTYGEWIKLATTSDLGNYLPLSGGTISSSKSNPLIINSTHVSQSSINFSRGGVNKGTVGFYENLGSFLQNVTGETLAVKSDGAYYGVNNNSLRKLATVTDLNNYLPLTGGTLSGALTINAVGSTPLIVNNSDTNGVDSILNFKVKGVNKTLVGYSNGNGPFIQDATNNRCIMVKSDGVYFGASSSTLIKLLTSTDLSGYLPLAGGTMTGSIIMNNNVVIQTKDASGNLRRLIGKGTDNVTYIGDDASYLDLYGSKIIHVKNGIAYGMWDENNLPNPVQSTSTKKVTDIQVVDALPATQASGVLYLVVK